VKHCSEQQATAVGGVLRLVDLGRVAGGVVRVRSSDATEDSAVVVADCKYKEIDGFPDHSDVYQLFSHCSALQARVGVLIYPGESYRRLTLGSTSSGISMHSACVRITNLREDLNSLLREILPTVGIDAGILGADSSGSN